jgi:hypothetical protein
LRLYPSVLLNAPEFRNKVHPDNKRFAYFEDDSWHPSDLDTLWASYFFPETMDNDAEPNILHVRKVNFKKPEGRELMAWIREKHIDRHERMRLEKEEKKKKKGGK